MNKKIIVGVIVLVCLVFLSVYVFRDRLFLQSTSTDKTVVFVCDAGKSISATFHIPTDETVSLTLSDKRAINVPHVISGSGARYANTDESFVFWNKGDTAFITEGVGSQSTTTFANCVLQNNAQASNMAVYKNTQYGFSLSYPKALVPSQTFKHYYHLGVMWRANTLPDTKGIPVVSIPVYQFDQGGVATGRKYPLYFGAEVRVGVSQDPTDVSNCLKLDDGYGSQKVTDVVIHGVPFKKFTISDGGMMQYLGAESYRTVHNNMCYVIEQLKVGSIYRDDTMVGEVPQAELDGYYATAGDIVQTFTFDK